MLGEILYTILSNTTSITNLVDYRIFPLSAPQGKQRPFIVYQQISQNHNKHKDRTRDKYTVRVQIDIIADTFEAATEVADALADTLSYYSGTVGAYEVEIITFEDENDLSDIEDDVYRKEQDYILKIKP